MPKGEKLLIEKELFEEMARYIYKDMVNEISEERYEECCRICEKMGLKINAMQRRKEYRQKYILKK